jgi:hypothetical protein
VERQRKGVGQTRRWIRSFQAGSPDGIADTFRLPSQGSCHALFSVACYELGVRGRT